MKIVGKNTLEKTTLLYWKNNFLLHIYKYAAKIDKDKQMTGSQFDLGSGFPTMNAFTYIQKTLL